VSSQQQFFISNNGYINQSGSGKLHNVIPAGRVDVGFTMTGPRFVMVKDEQSGAERLEYLPGSPAQTVVDDVRQFVKARAKFASLGLGYKRGYLMHGPPGTGKSATLQMVTSELVKEHDAVVIAGSRCSQNQIDALRALLGPERLIVGLVEEVDEDIDRDTLSMLDGTLCTNVVFLATTNYLDRLPPRIRKRPGRFDRVVDVAEYPEESRRAYFSGRIDKGQVEVFVKAARGLPISAWRELLIRVHVGGLTPAAAGKELRAWLKELADDDSEDE
jgi:ATP-dependent Zn protease